MRSIPHIYRGAAFPLRARRIDGGAKLVGLASWGGEGPSPYPLPVRVAGEIKRDRSLKLGNTNGAGGQDQCTGARKVPPPPAFCRRRPSYFATVGRQNARGRGEYVLRGESENRNKELECELRAAARIKITARRVRVLLSGSWRFCGASQGPQGPTDRGRDDRLSSVAPPSEPYGRFSRIRLSS